MPSPDRLLRLRQSLFRLRSDRRGLSSLAFAGSAVAVFGAQNASDAGATAAVMALSLSGPNAGRAAGVDVAGRNGFSSADGRTTVAVNIPPTSGNRTGDPTAVEVIVTQQQPMTAAALFLSTAPTVQGRTVGRLREGSNVCVLSLLGQVWAGGSTTVNVPNCVIASNRRNSPSIEVTGNALDINAFTLSAVSNCQNCDSARVTLSLRYREYQPPVEDPFAHLKSKAMPVPSGNCQNYNENTNPTPAPYELNGNRYYCSMHLTGGRAVQLSPGTYYIWNGDFRIGGGSSITCPNCTGDQGVTIVLTGTVGYIGQFIINSNSVVNLRAARLARDPDYNGVLLYRDARGSTGSTSSPTVQLNGGTNMTLVGGLYFPSSHVQVNGNATAAACTVLVASSIDFIGNAEVNGCGAVGTRVPRTRQVVVAE